MELPDWLRGVVLLGKDGLEYKVVGVDDAGYLGVILKAAAAVTIADNITVDQEDSTRTMQGENGETLHTVAVDTEGRLIMLAYGTTAVTQEDSTRTMQGENGEALHTIAVDTQGRIIMVPYGTVTVDGAVTTSGTATVTQADAARTMQGENGETLHTIAVDTQGRIIMVAYGTTAISGTATVTQADAARTMQGENGETLHTIAVDTEGRMIILVRGKDGNLLAVDAAGFMTTVIKGWTGSAYQTLSADTEGNITALLKDNADQWGKKISVGIAELAARLGSPISWDRRGQVAQIVTFANGLGHMAKSASSGGGVCALYPSIFQTAGYSLELTTGTGGGQSAGITTYGDYSPADQLGFEFTLSFASQVAMVYFIAKIWDGVDEHHAYARINNSNNKIEVLNSLNAYVEAGDFAPVELAYLFYSIKLVIDLDAKQWVRLLVRGVEYDLSAIASWSDPSGTGPYFSLQVLADHDAAVNKTLYLDRMVMTSHEP